MPFVNLRVPLTFKIGASNCDRIRVHMNRKLALCALKNLCTFIGATALFSYFFNWAVDIRHWYVTLASAIVCAILWFGFYVIERHGGVAQVFSQVRSHWQAKTELPVQMPLTFEAASVEPHVADAHQEAQAAPRLPWLNPQRSNAHHG
jgi:hypothetical protein